MQITDLCDNWRQAATGAGGLQLGANSEQFRLRNNGVFPHALSLDELREAHIELSRVMLLPGYASIIDCDHVLLWGWEAELLLGTHQGWPAMLAENDFPKSLALVVDALFAGKSYQNDGADDVMQKNALVLELLNWPANNLLQANFAVVAYLAFPLLEGLLKRRASAYVQMDGLVVAPFSVPGANGQPKHYDPAGPRKQINSLRDLLHLEHDVIADADLRDDIDALIADLPLLEPGLPAHGFDVLYKWRNTSLHGAQALPTIGATVLGLVLRILLSELAGDYETYRQQVVGSVAFWQGLDVPRNPWRYYPPTSFNVVVEGVVP